MNKWIVISIISLLAIGVIALGVFYWQESDKLKAAESEIVTLEGDVSTLEGTVSTLEGTVLSLEGDLAAAEAEVTRLEGELATAEAEVTRLEGELAAAEAEVTRLDGELSAAQAEVTRLKGELATAQAEVSTLKADLVTAKAQVSTLSEELRNIRSPRHFASLSELTSWLKQDDTNTKYAAKPPMELAFILQVKALRDGYLLPAFMEDIDYDGWYDIYGNLAFIGTKFYVVFPDDDSVVEWGYGPAMPSRPLPLE